jgi:hypothetical protein
MPSWKPIGTPDIVASIDCQPITNQFVKCALISCKLEVQQLRLLGQWHCYEAGLDERDQKHLFLDQAEGYGKAPQKSSSRVLSWREVF